MRLTQKCQVTIPKSVRDKLGIGPGSEVDFERDQSGKYMLVNLDKRRETLSAGDELVRHLQEHGRRAKKLDISTDELMEMTRGPFNDVDPHRYKRTS